MTESDDLDALRDRRRAALIQQAAGQADAGPTAESSPAAPVSVESTDELDQFVAAHPVVLVDFHADWCGPCQMLEPTVREIARDTDAAVAKVDVDALPALAQQLRIQGVPTLFLYADGEPVERLVGLQDYGTLSSLIAQHAG